MSALLETPEAPYGWEWDGATFRPCPEEQAAVRHMRQLAAFGAEPGDIADELHYDGFSPRRGRFTAEAVLEILARDEEMLARYAPPRPALALLSQLY
jgi:hypothetical protein